MAQQADKAEMPVPRISKELSKLIWGPDHNTQLEMAQQADIAEMPVTTLSEELSKLKCDPDHNTQLENYKSSLLDCENAIELKPNNMYSIKLGIHCAETKSAWDKMIDLCIKGIDLEPSIEELNKKKKFDTTEQENQIKAARKRADDEKKRLRLNADLVEAIRNRGIKIIPSSTGGDMDKNDPTSIVQHLQPTCWPLMISRVHLDNKNELVWPVLFRIEEYKQSETILKFSENDKFIDQFKNIFGDNSPSTLWDSERKYKPENLIIYFYVRSEENLILIDSNSTLKNVANLVKFEIQDGTPTFFVMVKESKFADEFYERGTKKDLTK